VVLMQNKFPGSGKNAIEFARQMAKSHSVEVLGWNDTPGKEYVFLSGDGDRLQAFQNSMHDAGWYIWPPDPGEEGFFLGVSLYPPTSDPKKNSSPGISEDTRDLADVPTGAEFRYSGANSTLVNNVVVLSIFPILFIWANKTIGHGWTQAFRLELSAATIIVAVALLLPLHWIAVYADDSRLVIRNGTFRRKIEIALGDIKRATHYVQRDHSIWRTRFAGINLKSGNALDIFLPARKQRELVAYLSARIRTSSRSGS
jgi:hypothetical protein